MDDKKAINDSIDEMDDNKAVDGSIDEMEKFPKDKDSPNVICQQKAEQSVRGTEKETLALTEENSSESLDWPCSISTKMSSRASLPTPKYSSQVAGNIEQTEDPSSNPDGFVTSQELRSRTKCSRIADAAISPLLNVKASSLPGLQRADATNIDRRGRSSLRGRRNARFTKLSERASDYETRSYSKKVKDTNTSSPVARSVEKVEELAPTKRMKKTPESDSSKSKSNRSKLNSAAAAKNPQLSPTIVKIQKMRISTLKDEESEFCTTPAIPNEKQNKRTIISCGESSTGNDSRQSNSQYSSADYSAYKYPNILKQILVRDVEKSENVTEEKPIISLRDHLPTDFHSPVKCINPDGSHNNRSIFNLVNEDKTIVQSDISIGESSIGEILDVGKQKEIQPASVSDQSSITFRSWTSTDSDPSGSNNDLCQRKKRLSAEIVSKIFESLHQENALASGMDPLNHKSSSVNSLSSSKLWVSTDKENESCIEAKETPDSLVASLPLLSSYLSSGLKNFSVIDFARQELNLDIADVEMKMDRNPPCPSTQISESNKESIDILKQSLIVKSPGMLQRSDSEDTIIIGEASPLSSRQPRSTEASSNDHFDSSTDVSQFNEIYDGIHGRDVPTTPPYDVSAQQILQTVLKKMLIHDKKADKWRKFEALFLRLPESLSGEYRIDLYVDLISYSASRRKFLWMPNMITPTETITENYLKETYDRLLAIVLTTLALTLSMRSRSDFDGLILNHLNFRAFFDLFSRYSENIKIEVIEDQTSRNQILTLQKMIESHFHDLLTAFEYLLLYISKNAEEKSVALYEEKLSEEDRKFLKRTN